MGRPGRNSAGRPARTVRRANSNPSHRRWRRRRTAASIGWRSMRPARAGWLSGRSGFVRSRIAASKPAGRMTSPAPGRAPGTGEEWVYVDLGAPCTFDRVALTGSAARRKARSRFPTTRPIGRRCSRLPRRTVKLAQPGADGRYVRVLMTKPASPDGYILSEMEVYGRGGPVAAAETGAGRRADGRLDLAGGAWRMQRDSLVSGRWRGALASPVSRSRTGWSPPCRAPR